MVEQVFFDGVPVKPGDGAQAVYGSAAALAGVTGLVSLRWPSVAGPAAGSAAAAAARNAVRGPAAAGAEPPVGYSGRQADPGGHADHGKSLGQHGVRE